MTAPGLPIYFTLDADEYAALTRHGTLLLRRPRVIFDPRSPEPCPYVVASDVKFRYRRRTVRVTIEEAVPSRLSDITKEETTAYLGDRIPPAFYFMDVYCATFRRRFRSTYPPSQAIGSWPPTWTARLTLRTKLRNP